MHIEAARQMIERRYATIHGAIPVVRYSQFCIVEPAGKPGPSAALGFRLAGAERLFLEDYLDEPVERAICRAFNMSIDRERIVEIGAHASVRSRATIALWARAARHLDGLADVAVAVLTIQLRMMFERLGIAIHDLGDADPSRLPGGRGEWGRYYDQQPRVCAGLIAAAIPKLASFDDGLPGICA